jgi:hypothetical protein
MTSPPVARRAGGGQRWLFVNANASSLRAELVGADGAVLPPFTLANSRLLGPAAGGGGRLD